MSNRVIGLIRPIFTLQNSNEIAPKRLKQLALCTTDTRLPERRTRFRGNSKVPDCSGVKALLTPALFEFRFSSLSGGTRAKEKWL